MLSAQNHSPIWEKGSQEGQAAQQQPALPRDRGPAETAGSWDSQVIRASEGERATLQVPVSLELVKTSG